MTGVAIAVAVLVGGDARTGLAHHDRAHGTAARRGGSAIEVGLAELERATKTARRSGSAGRARAAGAGGSCGARASG